MSTKSDRKTEIQLEEAYKLHKSYLKNDEDLKELCFCCEAYCGKEHDYEVCRNEMCFKCFLAYKYLKLSNSY